MRSDLRERIHAAQIRAGEQAVIDSLRERGLLRPGLCSKCGLHPADSPATICQGCAAYLEHQAV